MLDEKFVVTSIECFHKALECFYSRLSDASTLSRNEKFLEYSEHQKETDNIKSSTVAIATKTIQKEQSSTGTKTFQTQNFQYLNTHCHKIVLTFSLTDSVG